MKQIVGYFKGCSKEALFCLLITGSVTVVCHAQQQVEKPVIQYVSQWELKDVLFFEPGKKVIFNQQCTPSAPEKVVNGTILLENVSYGKERLQVLLAFKDTIVESVTYVFDTREAGLMTLLGIDTLKVQALVEKDEWVYVSEDKKTMITRVKRRILVKKTGISPVEE